MGTRKEASLPGFTAELSLQRPSGQYASLQGRRRARAGMVTPQLLPIRRPGDCIPGCICVSPFNCHCCESLLPSPREPWPTFPTILGT